MNVEIADLEISSPFIIQFDVPLPILKLQDHIRENILGFLTADPI